MMSEAGWLDGFFRISMALPPDFATMAMADVMSAQGKHDPARIARLRGHPAYREWLKKFGTAMNRARSDS